MNDETWVKYNRLQRRSHRLYQQFQNANPANEAEMYSRYKKIEDELRELEDSIIKGGSSNE